MSACIHCGGRGEVYDDTCGAWEPCPVKCEAWFRVLADDAVLASLETAYVPEERVQTLSNCVCPEHGCLWAECPHGCVPATAMFFHEAMFEADHQPEYKEFA